MDYLKYALEKQEINPHIEIFGGVGIEQINDAEKKLGILFPSQYKAFLLGCGSCGIADTYVSGLFKEWDNLTSTGSIVHDTIEAREKHNLPNEYIVIEYMVDHGDARLANAADEGVVNIDKYGFGAGRIHVRLPEKSRTEPLHFIWPYCCRVWKEGCSLICQS